MNNVPTLQLSAVEVEVMIEQKGQELVTEDRVPLGDLCMDAVLVSLNHGTARYRCGHCEGHQQASYRQGRS